VIEHRAELRRRPREVERPFAELVRVALLRVERRRRVRVREVRAVVDRQVAALTLLALEVVTTTRGEHQREPEP
jgi:hypothetical protein